MKENKEILCIGRYGFDWFGNLIAIDILYSKVPEAGISEYPIGTSPCVIIYENPIFWDYSEHTDVLYE